MKKQLTFATMLLFIIAGITTGCKKESGESRTLKKKIEGKWLVSKIESKVEGGETKVYTGLAADFIEFRNDENDQLDVNINGKRNLGSYAVLATDGLEISIPGEQLSCNVTTVNDSTLEFSATVELSKPQETRKYYLHR
ncbi:hypothetical protein [Pedobacter gandavensis]|uniref:Lipocalin-like domain-containing protein n=1 Tax=Pedobacter gandavensis TaxID=2679963 RepID=A0ABR6F293_9SPHI|nr:hypothetical protein [Pedobacter gandavensis]MBB2151653.1 hypothetical protein [Pedobacter gandavensis]